MKYVKSFLLLSLLAAITFVLPTYSINTRLVADFKKATGTSPDQIVADLMIQFKLRPAYKKFVINQFSKVKDLAKEKSKVKGLLAKRVIRKYLESKDLFKGVRKKFLWHYKNYKKNVLKYLPKKGYYMGYINWPKGDMTVARGKVFWPLDAWKVPGAAKRAKEEWKKAIDLIKEKLYSEEKNITPQEWQKGIKAAKNIPNYDAKISKILEVPRDKAIAYAKEIDVVIKKIKLWKQKIQAWMDWEMQEEYEFYEECDREMKADFEKVKSEYKKKWEK